MTPDAVIGAVIQWMIARLPSGAVVWSGQAATARRQAPCLIVTEQSVSPITSTTTTTDAHPTDDTKIIRTERGSERWALQVRALGSDARPWLDTIRRAWPSHDQALIDLGIGAGAATDAQRVPLTGGAGVAPEWVCTIRGVVDWSQDAERARLAAVDVTLTTDPDAGSIVVSHVEGS